MSSSPIESKESFSQLTLFLFASGLALFIALLGWSDQIRGIDSDTRDLIDRFLKDNEIQKRDFLAIVKPESLDAQLLAVTAILNAQRISESAANVLRKFGTPWNTQWTAIEGLSTWKYNLTIALTIVLFSAGIVSLFTTSDQKISFPIFSVRAEIALIVAPLILIVWLIVIIVCTSRMDKKLRILLNLMSDSV
jgi:hypothetical protein